MPSNENCDVVRCHEYRASPLNFRMSSAVTHGPSYDFDLAADEEIAAVRRASTPPVASRARPFSPASIVANGRSSLSEEMKLGAAGAAEVAELRVIDAELVVDVVDELGNEKIQIGVALTVPVRRHVDRHALEPRLEIGAVVEVEAANEVLIRFAVSGVLRDDQSRDGLEQLAFSRHRTKPEVRCADVSLRCGRRHSHQVVRAARDLNRVQRPGSGAVASDCGCVLGERALRGT